MAARPDEARDHFGPGQWRLLGSAAVRTGCPWRYLRHLPSIHKSLASGRGALPLFRSVGLRRPEFCLGLHQHFSGARQSFLAGCRARSCCQPQPCGQSAGRDRSDAGDRLQALPLLVACGIRARVGGQLCNLRLGLDQLIGKLAQGRVCRCRDVCLFAGHDTARDIVNAFQDGDAERAQMHTHGVACSTLLAHQTWRRLLEEIQHLATPALRPKPHPISQTAMPNARSIHFNSGAPWRGAGVTPHGTQTSRASAISAPPA